MGLPLFLMTISAPVLTSYGSMQAVQKWRADEFWQKARLHLTLLEEPTAEDVVSDSDDFAAAAAKPASDGTER